MYQRNGQSERRKLQNRLAQRRHRAKKAQSGHGPRSESQPRDRKGRNISSRASPMSPSRPKERDDTPERCYSSAAIPQDTDRLDKAPYREDQSDSWLSPSPGPLPRSTGAHSYESSPLPQEPLSVAPIDSNPTRGSTEQVFDLSESFLNLLHGDIHDFNDIDGSGQTQWRGTATQTQLNFVPTCQSEEDTILGTANAFSAPLPNLNENSYLPSQSTHQIPEAGDYIGHHPMYTRFFSPDPHVLSESSMNIESWLSQNASILPVNQDVPAFSASTIPLSDAELSALASTSFPIVTTQASALHHFKSSDSMATAQALPGYHPDFYASPDGSSAQHPPYCNS